MNYFRFLSMTILVFLFLSISYNSIAQVATTMQWQQLNGPFGGVVTAITYAANGNVIVGTKYGGIFRSISNGTKWVRSNLNNVSVHALMLDASGNVVAGTSNGIYHSYDHGNLWYKTSTGLTVDEVYSLSLDTRGTIYAGTYQGIFVSADNGLNWKPQGLEGFVVYSLLSNQSNKLYAGTNNGVYCSSDTGANWVAIGLQGFSAIYSLVFSNSGLLFAGNLYAGIYRGTEDSLGWVWTQAGLSTMTVNALSINPQGKLFAGTDLYGVFYSPDSGVTWQPSTFASGTVYSLNTRKSSVIFAGSTVGVFYSADQGTTWGKSNTGLSAVSINALEVDSEGKIFLATEHQGVYRSTDKGDSWQESNNTLPNGSYRAITIAPSGTLFVGHESMGVYRSTDFGLNWARSDSGLNGSMIN
ncbi:MAG: hypothetical protein HYZ34_00680, partial [Ignavibacteriae bacterium]|nr:hypothetical protein [Ignavibacteriota bacterium]